MIALSKEDRRKLELAGLIRPSDAPAKNKGGRPRKVTHTIAPKSRPPEQASIRQCRRECICIYCRKAPAKYFGPEIGYAVGCPRCTVERAARALERRTTHGL